LGARACDIIETLARAYGELIIKENLIRSVWPGVFISDNTLQVHISAIRRALGPYRALLKTESGRTSRRRLSASSAAPKTMRNCRI
jgi:non-specific serine/threonine protein kinase